MASHMASHGVMLALGNPLHPVNVAHPYRASGLADPVIWVTGLRMRGVVPDHSACATRWAQASMSSGSPSPPHGMTSACCSTGAWRNTRPSM